MYFLKINFFILLLLPHEYVEDILSQSCSIHKKYHLMNTYTAEYSQPYFNNKPAFHNLSIIWDLTPFEIGIF